MVLTCVNAEFFREGFGTRSMSVCSCLMMSGDATGHYDRIIDVDLFLRGKIRIEIQLELINSHLVCLGYSEEL